MVDHGCLVDIYYCLTETRNIQEWTKLYVASLVNIIGLGTPAASGKDQRRRGHMPCELVV